MPEELKEGRSLSFYEPVGCDACNGLGYEGRIGIFELLPLTVELQKIVSREETTIAEIQEAAKSSGMLTMEQDGLLKVIDGLTSVSEVMRAVRE